MAVVIALYYIGTDFRPKNNDTHMQHIHTCALDMFMGTLTSIFYNFLFPIEFGYYIFILVNFIPTTSKLTHDPRCH